MYRVAFSMLRTDRHNRAEDVIGKVMMSMVKNPPRQEVRNWEAFLVRAVQNKIRDLWKSAAHRHEQLVIDEATPLEDERHGGDQVEDDPLSGVVELIGRHHRVQTVQDALVELEAWDHQAAHVLWQCAGLERSSRRSPTKLGCPAGSGRSRRRRGIDQDLGGEGGGPMNEETDRLLEQLLEEPPGPRREQMLTRLDGDQREQIRALLDAGDLVWEAAHTAPPWRRIPSPRCWAWYRTPASSSTPPLSCAPARQAASSPRRWRPD